MSGNLIKSFISVVIMAASSLACIPFLTRHLTPSEFGHLSIILMFFTLSSAFDGLRPVIIYYYPRYHLKRAAFVYTLGCLGWIMGIVAGTITASIMYLAFSEQLTVVEIALLSGATVIYFPMTVRWAMLDAREKVGFTALSRAFMWLALYLSFVLYAGMGTHFYVYSASLLCMNIALFLFFFFSGKETAGSERVIDWLLLKQVAGKSKQYLFFQILVYGISFIDRMTLARLFPIAVLGYYTPQYELGTRSTIFLRIFNSVLYPRFSRLVSEGHDALVREYWLIATKVVFVFFSSVVWITIAWADVIVRVYAGPDYQQYSFVLQMIMFGVLMNLPGYFASLLLNSFGDFKEQGKFYLFGIIVGIISAYPLIKLWGMFGASLTFVSMHLVDVLLFLRAYKIIFGFYSKKIFIMFLYVVLVFIVEVKISSPVSGLMLIVLYGLIFKQDDFSIMKKIVKSNCKMLRQ